MDGENDLVVAVWGQNEGGLGVVDQHFSADGPSALLMPGPVAGLDLGAGNAAWIADGIQGRIVACFESVGEDLVPVFGEGYDAGLRKHFRQWRFGGDGTF